MYAAISPRDQVAGLISESEGIVHVLDRTGAPVSSVSAQTYLTRYPNTSVVDVSDGKEAVDVLAERANKSLCLDMTLLLFDREVSLQARQEIATELNVLFRSSDNKIYVLDIVLSRPLSPSADVDGAKTASKNSAITRAIVESIISCQDRVRLVFESWELIRQEPIVRQAGMDRVFALLSAHGVFRELALKATDTAQLNSIKSTLAMNAQLQSQLDAAPRVILTLLDELHKSLPEGSPANEQATLMGNDIYSVESSSTDPQHSTPHAAYTAAVSQVARIAEFFAQSKDAQANEILKELLTEQRKHTGGDEYIVKSLCNIASKVSAYGRPEISLQCLMTALTFPDGIDARLYFQIGMQLRDLRHFDKAIECYQYAQYLDDGTLSDRIHHDIIRITVAKGKYEEALSEYLQIPNLDFRPTELAGLGTLYRKMGLPAKAREAYRRCIGMNKDFYTAYAGLAEVRKQIGKPHQAIAEYNAILKRFSNLPAGPKKVYNLARSHLFRLTEQYEKSERLLRELLRNFPADRDVNLQFAKLKALQGARDQAYEYFGNTTAAKLDKLGQLVFLAALTQSDAAAVNDRLDSIRASLMPEDTGFARCIEAYCRIQTSDFEGAQEALRAVTFVDRLVSDFANVLCFHASRKINQTFDYKTDHEMCRLAKRSDRSLRLAMHLIDIGDFENVLRLESEFLLRIAA